MIRLSIIIPVFNAEATLESMLKSLSGQLTQQTEVVFIDDGSTDASPSLLDAFATQWRDKCKVIHQDNAGVAAARNHGIQLAKGDYLLFLDADDKIVENAIEIILGQCQTGADIIGWDWILETNGKRRFMRQPDFFTPKDALENLLGGTMKWNLWLFCVKRDFVEASGFECLSGADMGEDMGFMLKAFACAKQVIQIHQPLYCYNASNPASISLQLNERRRVEVTRNLDSVVSFLETTPYAEICNEYLPHLKLLIKRPLLIGFSLDNYRLWHQWMSEANPYATKNKELPSRVRILQGMAVKRLWIGVWLYNCCYRFLLRFK